MAGCIAAGVISPERIEGFPMPSAGKTRPRSLGRRHLYARHVRLGALNI